MSPLLPPTSEGKQLYGIGILSVLVVVLALTAAHFMLAMRVYREDTLRDRAVLLAGAVDQAAPDQRSRVLLVLAQRAEAAGTMLDAFVVASDGRVSASTHAEEAGQPSETVEARIHGRWPMAVRLDVPVSGGTLAVLVPRAAQATAAGPLLQRYALWGGLALLCFLPFFVLLNRNWLEPLHRVAQAGQTAGDGRGPPPAVPPASVPNGDIRELVTQRNQVLELLRIKEEALSRRTSDMEALYEFSRQIGLSREAPDIPDQALTFLARSVDYDVACTLVFTDIQRTLTIRSRAPMSEYLSADVERLAVDAYYEKSGILLEGEKLDTTQAVTDVRGARLDGKLRSAHWSPLTVERKLVGVVGILALADRHFTTDAVRFLNILTQNTSLALEKLHVMRIEETQRFRNVLENLAEGVVLVRHSGEWALATGPARTFHADICGPEATGAAEHSRQCPVGLLGLDIFHGGTAITREITRHERTFILSGTFVTSGAAGEQGAVISIRDVTEERATQQQLFQASKLASLGELAAGVAHEVNNPLTGILGFTELLMAREDITASVLESLQDIHSLARRTAQITMDLLIFARVQREGGFHPVDLRIVVRDTMKLLDTTYRNLNLEIAAEMGDAETPLVAIGDQGKIQQIVLNLAQNAKDAIVMSGQGSRIVFRGYRQREDVVVEVQDDGPGIPDRIRTKIFEPFFTTKPVGKGTGLGLAIVNRIVEEHKGKLIVDSDEGRGTRFRICLPAASAEQIARMPPPAARPEPPRAIPRPSPGRPERATQPGAPADASAAASLVAGEGGPHPPSPPSPLARGGYASPTAEVRAEAAAVDAPARGCIVVLDDEDTVLKFLTRTLQRDGVSVYATSSPTEAMTLIQAHRPDLLFLDFRMPEITGEEFYRQVVAFDALWSNRVVFLTGDATGDEIQGFLKSTGTVALTKPIGIRDLRDFVDKKLAEVRDSGAPNASA